MKNSSLRAALTALIATSIGVSSIVAPATAAEFTSGFTSSVTSFIQGGNSPEMTWTHTSVLTQPTNGQIQVFISSDGNRWALNETAFPSCDYWTGAPASDNPLSECGLTLLIDGNPIGSTSHVWYTPGTGLFQIFPETAAGGYYPVTTSTTYSLTFAQDLWNVTPTGTGVNMTWSFWANPDRDSSSCCSPNATAAPAHTVTFDANGGVGSMEDQVDGFSSPLSANLFTRVGYSFSGWATSSSDAVAGIVTYEDEEDFPFGSDATLFAVWASNGSGVASSLPDTGAALSAPTIVGVVSLLLGGVFLLLVRQRRVTVSNR